MGSANSSSSPGPLKRRRIYSYKSLQGLSDELQISLNDLRRANPGMSKTDVSANGHVVWIPDVGSFKEMWVMIEGHNSERQRFFGKGKVARPPLKFSWDLAREARDSAQHLLDTNTFQHAELQGQYGENIYVCTERKLRGKRDIEKMNKDACNSWIADYRPGKLGHFTQIIWPSTTEIGFAYAYRDDKAVVVARYWPAGNVLGVSPMTGKSEPF